MRFVFTDKNDGVWFECHEKLPTKAMTFKKNNKPIGRLNLALFHDYAFYRNAVYDSYKGKPDLAKDIKERKNEYQEQKGSKASQRPLYSQPLHHYSVAASLGAMKELKKAQGKMKCFYAYQNINGRNVKVGFVHFTEGTVDGRPVIYLAQAGVLNREQGVGRRLMECVLAQYPAGTEFYILTRIFNTEAKNLYGKRLGFVSIQDSEIRQLDYDPARYCGFKHTTDQKEIESIQAKMKEYGYMHSKAASEVLSPAGLSNEQIELIQKLSDLPKLAMK